MVSTVAGIATVLILAAWHVRNRRHVGWKVSADGRYFVCLGYPMVAIAVYWLVDSPTATAWEWALGNLWALAAMVSFVYGFNALNNVPKQQQSVSQSIESLPEPAPEQTEPRLPRQ